MTNSGQTPGYTSGVLHHTVSMCTCAKGHNRQSLRVQPWPQYCCSCKDTPSKGGPFLYPRWSYFMLHFVWEKWLILTCFSLLWGTWTSRKNTEYDIFRWYLEEGKPTGLSQSTTLIICVLLTFKAPLMFSVCELFVYQVKWPKKQKNQLLQLKEI